MYESNRRARKYLLEFEGCDEVWFKRHTRRKDDIFTQVGKYKATDLFNKFDGIAIGKQIIFFQVKTSAWPPTTELNRFAEKFSGVRVIAINVRNAKKGWIVATREYPYEKL